MMAQYRNYYLYLNKAIPFRVYYRSDTLKVYLIENIMHNFEWLSQYRHKLTDQHVFFVICGWYHSDWFGSVYAEIFERLQLKRENFFLLYNSAREQANLEKYGFIGDVINHNCWLDEQTIPLIPESKLYAAALVARQSSSKRHFLAEQVKNLALLCSGLNFNLKPLGYELPAAAYRPVEPLKPEAVYQVLRQSHCGLSLSAEEGACFSSSEYLLSGIPVVSTVSKGGRDLWYTDYNSIVCEADAAQVAEAVQFFVQHPRDPLRIRHEHIQLADQHRDRFVQALQAVFDRYAVNENAKDYFQAHFFNKMRKSYAPDFEQVF